MLVWTCQGDDKLSNDDSEVEPGGDINDAATNGDEDDDVGSKNENGASDYDTSDVVNGSVC